MKEKIKKTLCQRFSKAASTYDSYALVQKESFKKLFSSLPESLHASEILEIGCGTGSYTLLLAEKFLYSTITALDFSHAMIIQARQKCVEMSNVGFLCTDGEEFLQANRKKYDLITTNATLQWFDDLPLSFACIAESLARDGIFHASLFGPQTLHQLAEAMEGIFPDSITLPAASFKHLDFIRTLAEKHFDQVEVSEVLYERRYSSLRDMLAHIRKTGTGGYQQSLPLLTRKRQQKMQKWFDDYGGYLVTYQVFFLSAWNVKER